MLGALELEKVTMPAVRVNLPIFPDGWNTDVFIKIQIITNWLSLKMNFELFFEILFILQRLSVKCYLKCHIIGNIFLIY